MNYFVLLATVLVVLLHLGASDARPTLAADSFSLPLTPMHRPAQSDVHPIVVRF